MHALTSLFASEHWFYYLINSLYLLLTLGLVGVIILENRNPVKTLAWVVVLLFLPVAGIVLYLFFGQDYTKQRMISNKGLKRLRKQTHIISESKGAESLTAESRLLVQMANASGRFPLYTENRITLYTSGKEKFHALKKALSEATSFIHIQYYIFADDALGRAIRDILVERSLAGVEVRLLYDDVGSWHTKKRFFRPLIEAGAQVLPFLEVTFPQLTNKINYRNHRKVVVIDGHIGFVGGMNIASRYLHGVKWGCWRDTHMAIQGSAVQGLQSSFSIDWNFAGGSLLSGERYYPRPKSQGDVKMQVVTGGPIGEWNDILLPLLRAISTAKRCIYIQTPYFLPNEAFTKALQIASLAGVDVQLMIPKRGDTLLAQLATYSFIKPLLLSGVKVFLYQGGFLHAKMLLVDDEFVTIGSTNMDFRSFEHNFEINALIYNTQLNKECKEVFEKDLTTSQPVHLTEWLARPRRKRFVESVVRLLSPLL